MIPLFFLPPCSSSRASASEMTYIVSSGALNSTHSLTSSRVNGDIKVN